MAPTSGDSFTGVVPFPAGETVRGESIASQLILACVLGTVLSLGLLLLRLYTAWHVVQKIHVDDCASQGSGAA